MAEPARLHETAGPVAGPKPALQLVSATAQEATPEPEMPNIGRNAMIGYLTGFVVATVVITVVGTLSGLGLGASFGLGFFVGMWGGGGFGFMVGGSLPLALQLDAKSPRSTTKR